MKKFFILLIIYLTPLFTSAYAQDKPLEVGVVWDFNKAREEAFIGVEYNKDISSYPSFDPNYEKNILAIKNGLCVSDNRAIMYYSDNAYSIRVLNDSLFDMSFVYDSSGKLKEIDFDIYSKNIKTFNDFAHELKNKTLYPLKIFKYNYLDGKLLNVIYDRGGDSPQYIFKPNGDLESYWIGKNCYNPDGSLQMKRDTKPFTEE